jgi:hypothetical protein
MSNLEQRGTWDTLGGPTMTPHHMVARPGPGHAVAWCGAPSPPLTSPPATLFSYPKYIHSMAQTRVLAVLARDFSISLLSPSLLLRFGAFVLRYVTPSIVQVEFYLVEYILSILAL